MNQQSKQKIILTLLGLEQKETETLRQLLRGLNFKIPLITQLKPIDETNVKSDIVVINTDSAEGKKWLESEHTCPHVLQFSQTQPTSTPFCLRYPLRARELLNRLNQLIEAVR